MEGLGSRLLFITVFFSCVFVMVRSDCPKNTKNPNNVNGRINMLKDQRQYTCKDSDKQYSYELTICGQGEDIAVKQIHLKSEKIYNCGTYLKATLRGGTDWLMVTYDGGQKYNTHCQKQPRKSDLIITCDPSESRGTLKMIEEHRTNSTSELKDPCYYLFELNHKAACTAGPPKTISPGSILLIIFLIVVAVYLVLGFLYQRFVAGAKGLEQIPNFNIWRAFGNLQADGCNFICRCAEVRRVPRYKPVEDALSDDTAPPDDDKLLPM